MDEYELVGCAGKEAFTDRHTARRAAERRPGRIVYHCRTCGLYHVGSNITRQRKLKGVRLRRRTVHHVS